MTIRTTLFPLGYSGTSSPQPQPTGDTPLLLGLSYKKAVVEQDLTPPTNYDISYTLKLQSDVYRYELDMSNVADVNNCWLNIDWGDIFTEAATLFDSMWGCAFELYLNTPPNDIQLRYQHTYNGAFINTLEEGYDFDNKYHTGGFNPVQTYNIPANTSLRFEFWRWNNNNQDQWHIIVNSIVTTKVMEI